MRGAVPRARLSVQAITWRYCHPLGIHWGEEGRDSADQAYPGHVREFGGGFESSARCRRTSSRRSARSVLPQGSYDIQNEKSATAFSSTSRHSSATTSGRWTACSSSLRSRSTSGPSELMSPAAFEEQDDQVAVEAAAVAPRSRSRWRPYSAEVDRLLVDERVIVRSSFCSIASLDVQRSAPRS